MDTQQLVATGLTQPQAEAYALLIELGEVRPPVLAARLGITRTNAYKLLDKLVELRLATKREEGKKFVYLPANPTALASLVSKSRAEVTAREEAVGVVMQDLLARYHTHSDKPAVEVVTGRKAVAALYRQQINLREDIRFIHTYADVAAMGFETMADLRTTPARHGKQREAIMFPAKGKDATINHAQHKRSNLSITFADPASYNAPVEWSVTDSSLLIVLYATEPHAILITDPVVAGAFLQLFHLLQTLLNPLPVHQALKEPA